MTTLLDQRLDALKQATAVRVAKAQVKQSLREGNLSLQGALNHWSCAKAEVFSLLICVPKIGKVKAMKLLREAHVKPSRRVDSLTEVERRALVG